MIVAGENRRSSKKAIAAMPGRAASVRKYARGAALCSQSRAGEPSASLKSRDSAQRGAPISMVSVIQEKHILAGRRKAGEKIGLASMRHGRGRSSQGTRQLVGIAGRPKSNSMHTTSNRLRRIPNYD